MRGKLGSSFFTAPNCRITPADAGKTSVCIICNIFAWDHPRGCGENLKVALCGPVQTGSPPRMRGKPKGCVVRASANRITPADAGKTPMRYTERRKNRDHPRGCGENPNCLIFLIFFDKSPPRMRGKRDLGMSLNCRFGITPADAGKTILSVDVAATM